MYPSMRPTCDANHCPLSWVQDLPRGRLGALDPLVLGQVPRQGVSRTGGSDLLHRGLLLRGLDPMSVFAFRHCFSI